MNKPEVMCFVSKTCGKRYRGLCEYCSKNIYHKKVENHYEEVPLSCWCCGNTNVVDGCRCVNCGETV